MKLFLKIKSWFTNQNLSLSNIAVYNKDGDTRHFTTDRLDSVAAKKLIKHLFKSKDVWLVEVDGEPFYARGNHVKRLKD